MALAASGDVEGSGGVTFPFHDTPEFGHLQIKAGQEGLSPFRGGSASAADTGTQREVNQAVIVAN